MYDLITANINYLTKRPLFCSTQAAPTWTSGRAILRKYCTAGHAKGGSAKPLPRSQESFREIGWKQYKTTVPTSTSHRDLPNFPNYLDTQRRRIATAHSGKPGYIKYPVIHKHSRLFGRLSPSHDTRASLLRPQTGR
jgi:hypothetical protein